MDPCNVWRVVCRLRRPDPVRYRPGPAALVGAQGRPPSDQRLWNTTRNRDDGIDQSGGALFRRPKLSLRVPCGLDVW